MHKKKCKKVFTLFIQNFRKTKWLLTCTNITKFASYCLSDTLTSVQELSFSTIMVIAVAGTSITIIICLTVCLIVFCRGRKAQSELYLTFGLTPSSNLTHVWKADSNFGRLSLPRLGLTLFGHDSRNTVLTFAESGNPSFKSNTI